MGFGRKKDNGSKRARKREKKAAKKAEKRAREDAERFEEQMRETEERNAERLAQIQDENQRQQAAMEATMQTNVANLTREPTTIQRKKRKKRGSGSLGRDSLRIALQQPGTSTNLG